ncbi:MAG: GAF domain-containing protein, partial [Methanobacteriota archaeon]
SRLAEFDTDSGDLTGKTPCEIIHELRVHQIELEIQNENLKKVQQDLEHSRNRYIDLYDFAPVGYITLTNEGLISEVNLTGATLLGVVRIHLIHTRFRKFVSPGDLDQVDRFFIEVLDQHEQVACQVHLIRPDGTSFFSRIEGIRVILPDGSSQIRLAIIDISVQHELALRSDLNSQRILSLLGLYQHIYLNDTAFMEYVLEESLKVVQSSIGFIGLISDDEQTMYGHAWSREAIMSSAVQTVPLEFPIPDAGVWADSVRQKRPIIINDYETLRSGMKFLPQGHIPIIRMISVPVVIGDHAVAVIAGANKEQPYDEEDEKALTTLAHTAWELLHTRRTEKAMLVSEKRLRKAQYVAKFGNLIYDTRSGSITLSDEVFRIFGIDLETWTGSREDFFKYIHPDDRNLVTEAFRVILEDGGKGDLEHRVIKTDETVRWVHVIAESIKDEEGNRIGIEGVIHDITERKQSEKERVKSFTQISKNIEHMAILNDEIRNPLAIITAACDVEEGRYTETILQAVTDIDKIIDRLDKGWLESAKIRTYLKSHYGF